MSLRYSYPKEITIIPACDKTSDLNVLSFKYIGLVILPTQDVSGMFDLLHHDHKNVVGLQRKIVILNGRLGGMDLQ